VVTPAVPAAALVVPAVAAVAAVGVGEGLAKRGVTAERARATFTVAFAADGQRVRLSRVGGRSYLVRWERALRPVRSAVPAAVRLYGLAGRARCLALDFDTAAGGRERVLADCERADRLVSECGGAPIVDASVGGGRHLDLLLAAARHVEELRPALRVLQGLLPTLDVAPLLTVRAGCLRPPGAAHRAGGSQRLVTPWRTVGQVVRRPAAGSVWAALLERLSSEAAALPTGTGAGIGRSSAGHANAGSAGEPWPGRSPAAGGPAGGGGGAVGGLRLPSARLSGVPCSATWDPGSYATTSGARFAVVCSLVARDWPLAELVLRMEDGTWLWPREFYARYEAGWRSALLRDWRRAQSLPARPRPGPLSSRAGTAEPRPATASCATSAPWSPAARAAAWAKPAACRPRAAARAVLRGHRRGRPVATGGDSSGALGKSHRGPARREATSRLSRPTRMLALTDGVRLPSPAAAGGGPGEPGAAWAAHPCCVVKT